MAFDSKNKTCKDCLTRYESFGFLSEDELQMIENDRVELKYKKGEIICKQGSYANNIIHISEGLAKIYIEHNQKNLILKLASHQNLIGLPSIFNYNVYPYTVSAITDSIVCSINVSVFVNLIRQNPKFAENIISLLNKNTVQHYNRFISLTQKQSHGKIADAILHLSNDVFSADEFDLPITRRDFAELTGMSTENVIRILKELHNDRIIELESKKIKIISKELLQKLSEFG
jgi:CRP/FNR family transcriptional regulator, polysaccharide utilization system transcription regulator